MLPLFICLKNRRQHQQTNQPLLASVTSAASSSRSASPSSDEYLRSRCLVAYEVYMTDVDLSLPAEYRRRSPDGPVSGRVPAACASATQEEKNASMFDYPFPQIPIFIV